jgi:hypothetical protein
VPKFSARMLLIRKLRQFIFELTDLLFVEDFDASQIAMLLKELNLIQA